MKLGEVYMSILEGLIRFLLGGTLVLLVSLIAKNGKSDIAGIVALFPIITAVSFYFMSKSVEVKTVKNAVLMSVFSLPTTLAFLLSLYFCIGKMNIILALTISVAAWLVAAVAFYYLKLKLFG